MFFDRMSMSKSSFVYLNQRLKSGRVLGRKDKKNGVYDLFAWTTLLTQVFMNHDWYDQNISFLSSLSKQIKRGYDIKK